MNIDISIECKREIERLVSRVSGSCLDPEHLGEVVLITKDQGLVIFAIDKGPDTVASLFAIKIANDLETAIALRNAWGTRPLSDGRSSTMNMVNITDDDSEKVDPICINLSAWLVAWREVHGISLAEQVEHSDCYAHFFIVKGNRFLQFSTATGPRLPEFDS